MRMLVITHMPGCPCLQYVTSKAAKFDESHIQFLDYTFTNDGNVRWERPAHTLPMTSSVTYVVEPVASRLDHFLTVICICDQQSVVSTAQSIVPFLMMRYNIVKFTLQHR